MISAFYLMFSVTNSESHFGLDIDSINHEADNTLQKMKALKSFMSLKISSMNSSRSQQYFLAIDGNDIVDIPTGEALGSVQPKPNFTVCFEANQYKHCTKYAGDEVIDTNGNIQIKNLRNVRHFTVPRK